MLWEHYYLVFVLGYDLLHDELDGLPCDIAYETAFEIIRRFIDSSDYRNVNIGTYTALERWLNKNYFDINYEIEKLKSEYCD